MIGNTDTRHYWNLTDSIYRFSPQFLTPDDLHRFHGVNERIGVTNYAQIVDFYWHLMRSSLQDVTMKMKDEI